jgi:hypothetical protein
MHREFTQELRGDVRKEAIDINDHLDKKKLMEVVLHIFGFAICFEYRFLYYFKMRNDDLCSPLDEYSWR